MTFYPKHKEIIHFYGLVSNNTYLEIRQELGDIPLDSNPMRDRDLKPIITEILERKKQRKIDLPYQNEYNPNPNENSLKYKTSKELYKKHLKDLYREIRVIRKRKYCRICGSVATIEWTDPFPWYGYHFNYNLSDNENYVLPQEDPPPSIT